MFKISLMILLTVISSSAIAEWTAVGVVEDTIHYVDFTTTRKNGDRVKIWELQDYKTIQTVELSTKVQWEYDCKEEQSRLLAITFFSDNMGKGRVLHSDFNPSRWRPVELGSIGESLFKIACGK